MPKKRQPKEIWLETRVTVLERDGYQCVRCLTSLAVGTAHIDHIQSGKRGTNNLTKLTSLCQCCHIFHAGNCHQGVVAAALRDSIIPATSGRLFGRANPHSAGGLFSTYGQMPG